MDDGWETVTQLPDRTPWIHPDPEWDITQFEDAMRAVLYKPPFKALLFTVPQQVYAAMSAVMHGQPEGHAEDVPKASQVTRRIFLRLMQDLRSAQQLASMGYAPQAGTIGTTVAEIAFEVAWIGRDEARAEAWLAHEKRNKTVQAYGDRLKLVLSERYEQQEHRKAIEEFEIGVYRELCMMKHANSVLQQSMGSFSTGEYEYFSPIPAPSPTTVRVAAFAMYHVCRLCLDASMDFLRVTQPGTPEHQAWVAAAITGLMGDLVAAFEAVDRVAAQMEAQEEQEAQAYLARRAAATAGTRLD